MVSFVVLVLVSIVRRSRCSNVSFFLLRGPQNVRDFFFLRGFTPADVFCAPLASKCHADATEDTICLARAAGLQARGRDCR